MTARFWDRRADKYDADIRNHDTLYDRTISAVAEILSSEDIVLDVGCGSGEHSVDLATTVQSVHSIDTSSTMIALARDKAMAAGVANMQFDTIDVLEINGKTYSAALALNVLHLVEDVEATLERLRDLLLPKGLLISQTPCLGERGWLFRLLIGLLQAVGLAPSIHRLTTARLEHSMSASGFEVIASDVWDRKTATRWIVARRAC